MASRERSFTVSNGKVTYGADRSSYQYQYDACNNLTKLVTSVGTSKWTTTYTYDVDNRPKTTTLSTGKVITNTYDTVNRLTKRTIGLSSTYTTTLEYYANTATLSKYKNGTDLAYVYLYDDNGNITQIKQNGVEVIGYTYDSANRLTRENNTLSNQTVTYTYDTWGNLTSKKTYDYTTGTVGTATSTLTYTYGNSAWCDQLTKLNSSTITYDGNGNPLSYRGWTFSWRGKQLISATKDSNTLTFAYDENGLRHKKVWNDVTTNYYYNGSVLIGMERAGTKYLFSYDASGNVVSVKYNGAEYYYLRNGQGDIVKLIDASGATVVEYVYDTWGKKISTTGSMAGTLGLIQPFRYRGYVYDFEWGYYYLESRYYDTYTGRFISSDVLLSTGQGVLGHNSYAYCNDNPVNMVDDGGDAPWHLIIPNWGYVHRKVQNKICENNNYNKEHPCSKGKIDIIDTSGVYIWEVKYCGLASLGAKEQLNRYLSGAEGYKEGSGITPCFFYDYTERGKEIWISYWEAEPGIILYAWGETQEQMKKDMIRNATGASALAVLFGSAEYVKIMKGAMGALGSAIGGIGLPVAPKLSNPMFSYADMLR